MLRPVIELNYDCDRGLLGAALADRFRPLALDEETTDWIAQQQARPHGLLATALMQLLSRFSSSYDVHGLLGAYSMHLLSEQAWGELLEGRRATALLDVGAGAGYVTERARAWADEIVCTESSPRLRARAIRRGLDVHDVDLSTARLGRTFDVVSCLNVLDRTARPLSLLAGLREHLMPGGRLIVSIPLPPQPHVHVAGGTVAPSERLPSVARSWEIAARELTERLFIERGFTPVRLARVPYLSRGDARASLYVLDAAVWVLSRA